MWAAAAAAAAAAATVAAAAAAAAERESEHRVEQFERSKTCRLQRLSNLTMFSYCFDLSIVLWLP